MYKPSPLSLGSPRASPFRRPESPASQNGRAQSPSSPSLGSRPVTPTLSPTKTFEPRSSSPSKLQNASTPTSDYEAPLTPRGSSTVAQAPQRSPSPLRTPIRAPQDVVSKGPTVEPSSKDNDPISKLPGPQVREMREAFQMLDRDNDGLVNRDDIADILQNLALPSGPSDVTPYFPPGAPQSQTLPAFLSTLSTLLAPLSGQQELLTAFEAFDDQDDGEIDVKELRDALLNTAPEPGQRMLNTKEIDTVLAGFTGKKAFGKSGTKRPGGMSTQERGEMFRYRDWVGGLMGSEEQKVDV